MSTQETKVTPIFVNAYNFVTSLKLFDLLTSEVKLDLTPETVTLSAMNSRETNMARVTLSSATWVSDPTEVGAVNINPGKILKLLPRVSKNDFNMYIEKQPEVLNLFVGDSKVSVPYSKELPFVPDVALGPSVRLLVPLKNLKESLKLAKVRDFDHDFRDVIIRWKNHYLNLVFTNWLDENTTVVNEIPIIETITSDVQEAEARYDAEDLYKAVDKLYAFKIKETKLEFGNVQPITLRLENKNIDVSYIQVPKVG